MNDYSSSLESAENYLKSSNFSAIINKMVLYDGWRMKDALKTCEMYKNFLYLMKKYGDKYRLCPSDEIDLFWHMHILDTKFYFEMCNHIFDNKYLHHYPYFGIDDITSDKELNDSFYVTQQLYFKEFNELIVPTKFRYKKWLYFILYKIDLFKSRQKLKNTFKSN